jgi:hypothetical protein
MNTATEDRVREVLARQAAALVVPDVRVDDVTVVEPSARGKRASAGRLLLAAATVAVVGAGAIVIAQHRGESPAAGDSTESPGNAVFTYVTPTVQFAATSIEVRTAGRTFVPPSDTTVHSDPGTPNEYTTLELEWNDGGIPMRINLYFASDGTNWWASEIRTYDGSAGGEWITQEGQFFRTPLQSTFQGDLDAGPLHIRGLSLKAFPPPLGCHAVDKTKALVASEPVIVVPGAPVSGYATSVSLIDTATCQPVDVNTVRVDVTVDDPTIVELVHDIEPVMPTGVIRVNMHTLRAGTTKVHVKVSDPETGAPIDEVAIDVTAQAG